VCLRIIDMIELVVFEERTSQCGPREKAESGQPKSCPGAGFPWSKGVVSVITV
jgi:hypothetical protein